MFEKLKALFRRSRKQAPANAEAVIPRQFIAPRSITSSPPSRTAGEAWGDVDLAASYAVGLAANNALIGYAVGGSLSGGLAGDIARDGGVFERGASDCGASSSYDSGSSSSCDSGFSSGD